MVQISPAKTTSPEETIYTDEHQVGCDGGNGPLGHPLVYLELGHNAEITCPYCSRHFAYKH